MKDSHRSTCLACMIVGMGPGIFAGIRLADNNTKYATSDAGVWLGGLVLFAMAVGGGAMIGWGIGDLLNVFDPE